MQYTINSDDVHIALDEDLVDTIDVGDAIEIKEYAVNYIISKDDMDLVYERPAASIIFLELRRSVQPEQDYHAAGLRIYSL
jgi:hypothetical protein